MNRPPFPPQGALGRVFGQLMEAHNRDAYAFAMRLLEPKGDDSILDIGFGTGALITLLAPQVAEGLVAGVDPSQEAVGAARARNREKHIDLRVGNVSSLPWPDATFHKAVAVHSFHFWPDPLENLREIRRVLRPGGWLLLLLRDHSLTANLTRLPNPLSRALDEPLRTMEALRRAGFIDVRGDEKCGTSAVIHGKTPSLEELPDPLSNEAC